MSFSVQSKKSGKTYFLHQRLQELKGGQKVTLYYFAGEAKEGANSFTVYGDVDPAAMAANPSWRPGMAGEARVDVANRSLAWTWTHRLIDFLRLKLWL